MDQANEPMPHPPMEPAGSIPTELTVGGVFGAAHDVLKNNYGTILGAVAILIICAVVVSLVSTVIDEVLVDEDDIIQPASMLTGLFVLTPLYVGPALLAAMRYRAGRGSGVASGSTGTVFAGFTRYPTVLGIAAIINGVQWALMITIGLIVWGASASMGMAAAAIIGLVLGLPMYVVMIWLSIRIGFAMLLSVDPMGTKPGAIEAIGQSWRLTAGHAWMLFAIGIVLGLVVFLSMLLLVLPAIFYGIPLALCGWGVMYMLVAGTHLRQDEARGNETDSVAMDAPPAVPPAT